MIKEANDRFVQQGRLARAQRRYSYNHQNENMNPNRKKRAGSVDLSSSLMIRQRPSITKAESQSDVECSDKSVNKEEEHGGEITGIAYYKDIGLIVTTFEGSIKIMDNCTFKTQWCSSNSDRKIDQHATISTFDVSTKLGLMATGGDAGKLLLIDPYG